MSQTTTSISDISTIFDCWYSSLQGLLCLEAKLKKHGMVINYGKIVQAKKLFIEIFEEVAKALKQAEINIQEDQCY